MPKLFVQPQNEASFPVPVEGDTIRIGRSKKNEVCLGSDAAVSRYHAEITVEGESYFVRDLGSSNGTFVNGSPIDRRTPLPLGSHVHVGNAVITLRGDGGAAEPPQPPPVQDELPTDSVCLSVPDVVSGIELPTGTVGGLSAEIESPRARAFGALSHWATQLMEERPLPEILSLVVDMVVQAIDPERAAVLLLEDGTLTPGASWGMRPGGDGRDLVSRTIANRVIQHQQSVLTADAQIDPEFMDAKSIGLESVHSAMSVPLWNNTEVIGIVYADRTQRPDPFRKVDLEVLTLLANLLAIKIDHVRLFERDQKMRELERELQAAEKIQRRLLPQEPPSFAGYDIHGRNDPCHAVGGDYFDFQPRDNGCLGIALGDVTGHGIGAALLMATIQSTFRAHAATSVTPEEIVARLNCAVCANSEANKFSTFFYGELDGATHTLRFVNAGHNPPLLLRADGTLETLRSGGLLLGFDESVRYESKDVILDPGDVLLVFTDGVTESNRGDGEEFGEQRLERVVRDAGQATAEAIARRIREEVDVFTEHADPFDDFTICVVRRTG